MHTNISKLINSPWNMAFLLPGAWRSRRDLPDMVPCKNCVGRATASGFDIGLGISRMLIAARIVPWFSENKKQGN